MLALSGGAQNGAYGAGFLSAWMHRGADRRPRFDVVTGVSTGALQSSFVFVDTATADGSMGEAYRNAGVSDLIEKRSILTVPFSSSMATAEGLTALIAQRVSDDLIDAVAAAGAGDRQLLVGTVNLDRGILNLWDMVAIAKRRDYALYRRVLLASASQPPVFPPVCIDGAYHMDGGVREQIFVPRVLQALARGAKGGPGAAPVIEAYFLVNGVLPSDAVCVQPGILDIGLRSVDLLATEARVGNLWKSWSILRRESNGATPAFHLASIPPADAIHGKSSIDLDRGDVRLLYERGLKAASGPSMPWVVDPNLIPDEFIEVDGR